MLHKLLRNKINDWPSPALKRLGHDLRETITLGVDDPLQHQPFIGHQMAQAQLGDGNQRCLKITAVYRCERGIRHHDPLNRPADRSNEQR